MSINMMCAHSPKTSPEGEKKPVLLAAMRPEIRTQDSYLPLIKKRKLLALRVQETPKRRDVNLQPQEKVFLFTFHGNLIRRSLGRRPAPSQSCDDQ